MMRDHSDPDLKQQVGQQRHEKIAAAKEERENIKKAFEVVARTVEGKVVFNTLMKELGFKDTTIPGTSITNMNDIIFNESRRRVWIQIRALIPVDLRNVIEQDEDGAQHVR